MIHQTPIDHLLFIDVETVSQKPDFSQLDDLTAKMYEEKESRRKDEQVSIDQHYKDRAAILAEFGKIICISTGFITVSGKERTMRIKSFYGDDEKKILEDFFQLLDKIPTKKQIFCGHNIKEFDIPYICRRAIVNCLNFPETLLIAGKKPWEVNFVDTMEMWKFGDYKSFISLKLLAHILDVPTPKDDIDGSMVGRVYWEENNLERIRIYCQKDVLTVAQIALRFRNEPLLKEESVIFV